MAVTITLENALVAARIAAATDSIPGPVRTAASVLYDASKKAVESYAPAAPPESQNAAAVQMLAYLWSLDSEANPRGYQSALRNSGAAGLLAGYRRHRAGVIGGPDATAGTAGGDPAAALTRRDLWPQALQANAEEWPTSKVGNGVQNVELDAVRGQVVVTFRDGTEVRNADPTALLAVTNVVAANGIFTLSRRAGNIEFDLRAVLAGAALHPTQENTLRFPRLGGTDLDVALPPPADATARAAAAAAQAKADANAALNLPPFPAEGSRDNKVPKFDGDALGWEPDAGTGGGSGTDPAGVTYLEGRVKRLDDLTVDIEDDAAHRVYQPAAVATEGGMDEVSDFPADAAAAAADFGAADGTNSIALADQATAKIVFRIPKDASRTAYQVDAAGSLQVSSVDPVGGFGANVSGAWKYYQLTVKNVSGASTDVRLTVHDDVYRWRGKTLWQQVEGQEIDHQIASILNALSDLHAGSPATGWSALSAAAQGGIVIGAGGQAWTLTKARAVLAGAWGFSLGDDTSTGNYGLIRIPATGDPRNYRLQFTADADLGGGVSYGDLSHWTRLGESSDGNWQYYTGPGTFGGDRVVALQATGSAAHHGTSLFEGRIISTQVLAALGLAALAEANRGKFIKRKADETGFEYADAPTGAKPWTSLLSAAEGDGATVRGWDSKNSAGADEIGSRRVASFTVGAWRWVGSLVDSSLQKCVLPEGWSELWATGVGLSARLLAADITTAAYNGHLGTNVPFQYVRGTSRARGKNLIAYFAVTSSRELLIGFDADGGEFDTDDYSANMNIKVRVR
ncbi:MAG: hypothetical protein OXG38_09610 [Chloroflexi bacterium]|nr:hypothetical protein [Chloroflexota bacterium]